MNPGSSESWIRPYSKRILATNPDLPNLDARTYRTVWTGLDNSAIETLGSSFAPKTAPSCRGGASYVISWSESSVPMFVNLSLNHWTFLFARKTALDVGRSRLACCVLNNLPEETRKAFHAYAMEGKTVNRYVAEGNGPPERMKRLLRSAAANVLFVLEGR